MIEPGVHRLLGPLTTLVPALERQGWRVAVAAPARSTTDFYSAVADALELPDWFGRNLDALWDSLTDLAQPTALVLSGWTTFVRARPEQWSRIEQLLRERAAEQPPFLVVLQG